MQCIFFCWKRRPAQSDGKADGNPVLSPDGVFFHGYYCSLIDQCLVSRELLVDCSIGNPRERDFHLVICLARYQHEPPTNQYWLTCHFIQLEFIFFLKSIRYLAFFVNDEFVDHHPTRNVSHESNGRHKNGVAVSVGKGTGCIVPRKTNMPPEECWLEDEIPFEMAPFQVTCYFLGVYLLGSANE